MLRVLCPRTLHTREFIETKRQRTFTVARVLRIFQGTPVFLTRVQYNYDVCPSDTSQQVPLFVHDHMQHTRHATGHALLREHGHSALVRLCINL
jgi:hypothetical protein